MRLEFASRQLGQDQVEGLGGRVNRLAGRALQVDFGALHEVRRHWRGIGVTRFVNWAVKPFSMALLAWIFVHRSSRPGHRPFS